MNPLSLIVFLAILFLAWIGANALGKQGERRRERAVHGSHEGPKNVPLIHHQGNADKQFSRSHVRRSLILSVGRETNIRGKEVVCRACSWEGIGDRLSTGLVRIEGSGMYLYAYRCPVCGGFELSRKGKLLSFGSQTLTNQQQIATTEDRRAGGRLSQWK
jgi:hypothetical protein